MNWKKKLCLTKNIYSVLKKTKFMTIW